MAPQQYILLSPVQPRQRPFWEQPQYLYLGQGNSCEGDDDGRIESCAKHTPIAAGCVLQYRGDYFLLTGRDTVKLGRATYSYLASQRAKSDDGWLVLSNRVHVDERFGYVLAKLDQARVREEHRASLARSAIPISKGQALNMPGYEPTGMIGVEEARLWCNRGLQDFDPIDTRHLNGYDENDEVDAMLPRGMECFSVNFVNDVFGFGKVGTWIWDATDGHIKGVSIGAMDRDGDKAKSRTIKMGYMRFGRDMQDSILRVLARMSTGLAR